MKHFDVLIVGAGPAGLTSALLLEAKGIKAHIVDKRHKLNHHPKARNLNLRSAEIYRSLGIEKEMRKWDFPKEARRMMYLEGFCDKEIASLTIDDEKAKEFSPCEVAGLSQAALEEVLREDVIVKGIELSFKTEFISYEENKNGVIVKLQDENGNEKEVKAKYIIGADGARSSVRKFAKIKSVGKLHLGDFMSVYFKADPYTKAPYRPAAGYFMLGNKVFARFILSVNCKDKWLVGIKLEEGSSRDREDFDEKFCTNFIRDAFEIEDLDVEILDVELWQMRVQIAENFSKGHMFLVGDAAHILAPTGGFGLQTGIQDAHNLCWKLAAVIKGEMNDDILSSYHDERSKVVKSNMDWSAANAKSYTDIFVTAKTKSREELKKKIAEMHPIVNATGQDIGFFYESDLVISDGTNPLDITSGEYISNARPGARAPHLWLQSKDGKISILDLFNDGFVVLTTADQKPEIEKFKHDFDYKVITIGSGGNYIDIDNNFLKLYGINPGGYVVVRPDGHVYFRKL